ncbi:MAG: hypothetical protein J1D87_05815 [Lachnospiraceae bacterium]|nr:hypothetical protein [Lachnospiraceae bacterium]
MNQSKSMDTPKKKKPKNQVFKIYAAVLAMAAIAVFAYIILQTHKSQISTVEAMFYTEIDNIMSYGRIQNKKVELVREAGKDASFTSFDAMEYMLKGIENRPEQVELTKGEESNFATIESCLINPATGKVDIKVTASDIASSDDGYYYIFEEKTYEMAINGEDYIIEEGKDTELTFSVNLNYNSANSRLFSKFVVAMLKDGEFVEISKPCYITNPEAIAKSSPSFTQTKSKKGLLVDPNKLSTSELDDLGVKHAAYNVFVSRFFGGSGIGYTYNGKSYSFSRAVVEEYDHVFSTLTKKGIDVTAIILNDLHGKTELIHPLARSGGSAPYAAFNAADESGTQYLAAIASFLAQRYNGSGHGKVMNWIIGNEINARHEWNYIKYMETDSYVEEYAKAFRIFYNAIKSINGNARVYISLDQQWGQSLTRSNGYGSKEILDSFNRNIKKSGNINWGVAQHPYNYPLNNARAWTASGRAASYILDSETTPVLSIKNIHVLTDYLQKEEFLTDDGEVRHVTLSEMGYTSSAGQELQAASFVYAYKIVEANRYIDNLLLSRETDASVEVAQGLALGINDQGGGHKSIYNAYKYVDTDRAAEYTDFALRVIGISSWSEVIKSY